MTKEDMNSLHDIFIKTVGTTALSKGIIFFLQHFVRSGQVASSEDERKIIKWGCRVAKETLQNESRSNVLL